MLHDLAWNTWQQRCTTHYKLLLHDERAHSQGECTLFSQLVFMSLSLFCRLNLFPSSPCFSFSACSHTHLARFPSLFSFASLCIHYFRFSNTPRNNSTIHDNNNNNPAISKRGSTPPQHYLYTASILQWASQTRLTLTLCHHLRPFTQPVQPIRVFNLVVLVDSYVWNETDHWWRH